MLEASLKTNDNTVLNKDIRLHLNFLSILMHGIKYQQFNGKEVETVNFPHTIRTVILNHTST